MEQKNTINDMLPETDDLDVLQKQLKNKNFFTDAQELTNQYNGSTSPNKNLYLGAIRQKLENQAAGPSSYQRGNTVDLDQPAY